MLTASIRSTAVRIAVTGAAIVAMGASLNAGKADAAIGSVGAQLTISPYIQGQSSNVAVFGNVRMTRAEAQALINRGSKIQLRLWGEDTFSDDLILGPYAGVVAYASNQGLEFHKVLLNIPNSVLNEDYGMDELYMGVRLTTSTGATLRSGESNRWYDFF